MRASKIKNIWLRRLYLVTLVPMFILTISAFLYVLVLPFMFIQHLLKGVGLGFQLFWEEVERIDPSQVYKEIPARYKRVWYNEQQEINNEN